MNILKLKLKKEWFDKIKSGVKLEEYRDIKDHFVSRLLKVNIPMLSLYDKGVISYFSYGIGYWKKRHLAIKGLVENDYLEYRHYDAVEFTNGYRPDSPKQTLLVNGIRVGTGNKDWGAPDYPVFIIELGEPALTLQDIKDMQLQITCANEIEFTEVKNTLISAGLTTWVFQHGTEVIQIFNDEFIEWHELEDKGVVISADEFLKRFVYEK